MASLSILIPTFNRAGTLEGLIRALSRDPGIADVPIIVSDNASDDHTAHTVAFLQAEMPDLHLRVHTQPENLGPIGNLRWLVSAAETDYVWLFGDDDRPFADAVTDVLRYIDETDVAVLHLPHRFQSAPEAPYNDSPCPPRLEMFGSAAEFLARCGHWLSFLSATVVRRTALAQAMDDAPTANPWAPHIWYSLAAREQTSAIAPRRLVLGGGEISWRDQYRIYLTSRVIDAFDEGFCTILDESEYGRLLDHRYAQYGVNVWEPDAIDELVAAVGRFPTSRLMRQQLAFLAHRHRRMDVMPVVELAVHRSGDAEVAAALLAEGERRYLAGDHAGACEHFQQAIGLHPSSCDAWSDLGVALSVLRSHQAADAFDHALELDPDRLDVRVSRGWWATRAGLHAEAAHEAQWVLQRDPEHPEALDLLAAARSPALGATV